MDLPVELIYDICKRLPSSELSKFVRTDKDIHYICQRILAKRRETAINVKSKLDKEIQPIFEKTNPISGTSSVVSLFLYPEDSTLIDVSQSDRFPTMVLPLITFAVFDVLFSTLKQNRYPWILKGFKEAEDENLYPEKSGYLLIRYALIKNTLKDIDNVLYILEQNDYIFKMNSFKK